MVKKSTFDSLFTVLLGESTDWAKLALRLYLGQLHMSVVSIWKQYNYKKGKSTSSMMYWGIGQEIGNFLDKGEKGRANRDMSNVTLPHEALAELLGEGLNPDSGKNEPSIEDDSLYSISWGKRTFESCYYFYQLIPDKVSIDEEIPWSIYQEIASKKGKIELKTKGERKNIIQEAIKVRKEKQSKFTDRIIRVALDCLLSYQGRFTQTICREEFNLFMELVESYRSTRSNVNLSSNVIEKEKNYFITNFSLKRKNNRNLYNKTFALNLIKIINESSNNEISNAAFKKAFESLKEGEISDQRRLMQEFKSIIIKL